ncbi:antibiotic biosynthesis monooxygenase family protein [Phyllobacterium sp. SB3]|uniref:putative quinol monooxygenase n=1 Tax=Phyllobacterium sp. SB3 TaxID=3156073 RepID=UPI0032AF4AE9
MLIIAGHYSVSPERRQSYIDAFADLVQRARAYPGCIDLAISADPIDPSRVNMIEIWESDEVLKAWRKICNPPKTGVRMHNINVQKHYISRSEAPF